jgi:hypothetical protein
LPSQANRTTAGTASTPAAVLDAAVGVAALDGGRVVGNDTVLDGPAASLVGADADELVGEATGSPG